MDQATDLREKMKAETGRVLSRAKSARDQSFPPSKCPRVIAISSGKGGVGKTNIVGNLAVACQRIGKKVLIFDADLGLANIDIIFGVNPAHTIEEVIKGEKELLQIMVKGPEDVSLIPASSGVHELTNLTEGQKINLLSEFDILGNIFDLLLIDTGAGISSNVLYFNLAADERIVVVTPEPTSITDAYALMKVMFSQHGTKNFSLLINMVKDEKEAKSVYFSLSKVIARFMGSISLDYAGFIPWDTQLQDAVSMRQLVVCRSPRASSAESFRELARNLSLLSKDKEIDGNITFFWRGLLSREAE
ncbi:MAG: MinD/ParA family protein [Thermodesulfobacteriota bacterium]